jgi:hypothetical protein
MLITDIPVTADNVSILWRHARKIRRLIGTWIVPGVVFCQTNFDSEGWDLYCDFLLAYRRFGRRNVDAIADYLRPGREHWGHAWMLRHPQPIGGLDRFGNMKIGEVVDVQKSNR